MTGVFFVVCVPTCEQEAKLRQKYRRDRVRAHSDTTISFSTEDVRADVKRCRSTNDFASSPSKKANEAASAVVKEPKVRAYRKFDANQLKMSWSDIKQAITAKNSYSKSVAECADEIINKPEQVPLEKVVIAVLEHANVKDAVWCYGKEQEYYQVFFSLESGLACEEVLHLFGLWGVGKEWNSVVSVIPCALYYHGSGYSNSNVLANNSVPKHNGNSQNIENGHGYRAKEENNGSNRSDKRTAWSKFVSSVRARLTVAQVLQLIRADAALTFDWLFLLIVSAFVAAIGLVENSTVFLVASMLISPLMGPIMAGTFGTAIRDRDLQKIGVLHELFGLFLALVIGFLFGLILCSIDEKYGVGEWPTYEMMSRCEPRSLWVGALIAVPSGAAVAIAVLGDNTASLVGVAISASLLPPAVNAGLLWAMALVHLIFINDDSRFTTVVKTSIYSTNPATELAVDGTISLCLTLVNIVCIYFAGVLVYKVKEVAPINTGVISFWKKDDIIAVDSNGHREAKNQTNNDNAEEIQNGMNNEIGRHRRSIINSPFAQNNRNRLRVGASIFSEQLYNHATWSPASFDIFSRPHLRDVEGYYQDLANQVTLQFEDPGSNQDAIERRHPATKHSIFSPMATADNIRNVLGSKKYKHLNEESSPTKTSGGNFTFSTANDNNTFDGDIPATLSKFTVTPVPSSSTLKSDVERKDVYS